MTDTTLTLADRLQPGLDAGTYTIRVDHEVSVPGAPDIPMVERTFVVQGPRFALDPTEIHAVYPPANAAGPYSETLAHVVLTTPELPWERALGKPLQDAPWLALLVLDAAEIGAVATRTVDELLSAAPGIALPKLDAVTADERTLKCQTIDVPAALFTAVVPRSSELPLLAHTRDLSGSDAGVFSVVVANRLPAASPEGVRGVAHLVSLEGHEARVDGAPLGAGTTAVRLVSLASWSFAATPDTVAGESFKDLALGLTKPRSDERQDLALGLPYDKTATTGPAGQVSARLAAGYVPVSYHLPTGEDTFAWYRGPFAPGPTSPVAERPFPSSSAALIYDEATGTFDVSLATAWEIGRAIALADRGFTAEVVQIRRSAHRLLDGVVAALQSRHVDTTDADLQTVAQSGLIEQHFLERLKDGLAAKVAAVASGALPGAAPAPAAGSELPDDPVAAVKQLLERDDVQALVADDLEPIGRWLESLSQLNRVPFAYLVPHPRLLPVESARFFAVDTSWVGALVDGALSIGVQSSRDSWFQKVVQATLSDAAQIVEQQDGTDAAQPSGVLLRSALVSGWPGLTVSASAGGKPLKLLRSDRLAPSVLLCLFAAVPDTVSVGAPHQGLHFSLIDGAVQPRQRTAPVGKPVGAPITVDASLYRAGAERVLDVAGLAARLGATASADFALQMLYAPEEVAFTR